MKFQAARRAIAWVESKGLDSLDWYGVEFDKNGLKLSIYQSHTTAEQVRELKRIFGPLKVTNRYDKRLGGLVKLEDEFQIEFTLHGAFVCEDVKDPATLTEDRWDEIREMIREGTISIEHCRPAGFKESQ